MHMFKRAVKGNFGYISRKRLQTAVITAVMFIISVGIVVTGYITTGTRRNLLTIVGILGLLPASKSLVSLIMLIRAVPSTKELFDKISLLDLNLISMYDMYFTSYKKNYAVSHMTVYDSVIIGYSEVPGFDCKGCEEHIKTMLKQSGHGKITVCLVDKLDDYLKMLSSLNDKAASSDPKPTDDEIRISLYEIIL